MSIHNENTSEEQGAKYSYPAPSSDLAPIEREPNQTLGKYIKYLGGRYPLIQINGYYFTENEVLRVEITTYDKLPKCSLTLKVKSGIFLTRHFPKDGDLVNIFIRSLKDEFKPIRNDYLIDKISSSYSKDREGSEITFYINGTLRVPNLYAETCRGIKNKTSYEALKEIAAELELGFVSNETSPMVDKQNWLCAWQTNMQYIDYITKHSFKDLDSFYDSWIDYYYNLNFINMNKLLTVKDSEYGKDGFIGSTLSNDFYNGTELTHVKSKIVLTNYKESALTTNYFNRFRIINQSGELNTLNGYKRSVHFYNFNNIEHIDFKIDPVITESSEKEKVILKGRKGEDYYKTEIKSKWLGWQYGLPDHNVHLHYREAPIHNHQNLSELNKMTLLLNLPNLNFNLYKGQRLLVTFLVVDSVDRKKVAGNVEDDEKHIGFVLDRFLTGYYVILGLKLVYTRSEISSILSDETGKYSQEVWITRREWTVPNSPLKEEINY